jgi:hypothetical protein
MERSEHQDAGDLWSIQPLMVHHSSYVGLIECIQSSDCRFEVQERRYLARLAVYHANSRFPMIDHSSLSLLAGRGKLWKWLAPKLR